MNRQRIVVVGAGPVGMTAALALARKDVPVTVLEAGPDLATESRASTFHPPTLEMLDELGIIEPLLAVGLKAPVLQHRDFELGVIADLDAGLLADETPYPYRLQCEQHLLTRMIRDEIQRAGLDVEIRYDQPVAEVRSRGEGAEVMLAEAGAARRAVENGVGERVSGSAPAPPILASWVIAADGAHSRVREAAGIAFVGLTYPERYLVVTTGRDLREVLPGLAYVNYMSGPGDWCTLIRTNRAWRVLFPVPEGQAAEEAVDPARIQHRLAQLGQPDGEYPVEESSIYYVHERIAATLRAGRLLLAGDAGHINNPLGGLGMNSGIHDAYFLAGVLAQLWKGVDSDEALDHYSDVRRMICENYVNRVGDSNWSALRERDPAARRQRAEAMRSLAADAYAARGYLRKVLMLESVRETRKALDAVR